MRFINDHRAALSRTLSNKILAFGSHLPQVSVNDVIRRPCRLPDPILEDICMPPFAGDQWFLQNDIGVLQRIVLATNPRRVFEYGTAHGNTTANICKLCDATIYTLNALPEQMSGKATTFTLEKEEIGRVYRNYQFSNRVIQIYSDSIKFDPRQYLVPGELDLCIIDGCHDSDYVESDFMVILPYLKPGAICLLHDTHPSREGHLAGSYDACVRLRRKGFNICHLRESWWGFWKKPT